MKKKIIVFFTAVFFILIATCVSLLIIYHSDWAKQKNAKSLGTSSSVVELSNDERDDAMNYAFCLLYVDKEDFVDCEINVTELRGSIEVSIYALKEEFDDKSDYRDLMKPGYEIMRYELTDVGNYKYSLSEYPAFRYLVYIEITPDSEYAKLAYTDYVWKNNWNYWLSYFEIKKGTKIDVDMIKTDLVGK